MRTSRNLIRATKRCPEQSAEELWPTTVWLARATGPGPFPLLHPCDVSALSAFSYTLARCRPEINQSMRVSVRILDSVIFGVQGHRHAPSDPLKHAKKELWSTTASSDTGGC